MVDVDSADGLTLVSIQKISVVIIPLGVSCRSTTDFLERLFTKGLLLRNFYSLGNSIERNNELIQYIPTQ